MDRLSLIKSPVEDDLERFKNLFNHSMSDDNPMLHSVLVHIRKRQGKMMRPIIIMLVTRLLGEVSDVTLHAAVSLELLHTASLVHDDVVDDSGQRRGQASVNALFNNKVAVLSGDYILANSLYHAALTGNRGIINTISFLGQDLSSGELLQLSSSRKDDVNEDVYYEVIKKKTAALFSACTTIAAMSIDSTQDNIELLKKFGENVGICFQIRDDIFDYYDNSNGLGKPTGNDMLEGKLTLPAIYAYQMSGIGNEEIETLVKAIKQGNATSDQINRMIAFTKEEGGIDYAVTVMNRYSNETKHMLDSFPDSVYKDSLVKYVDYVVDRNI